MGRLGEIHVDQTFYSLVRFGWSQSAVVLRLLSSQESTHLLCVAISRAYVEIRP